MSSITLTVPARSARSYPIVVECGAIAHIRDHLPADADGVIVLCDAALRSIADRVSKNVDAKAVIEVRSGEASKTLTETERLVGDLLKIGATRKTVLINIGGGMLTDLGGFVAAVFMRGIRYIHVPTSMLCMTDAAVGGKTGVDLGETKNIIGAIHQPTAVICDIDLLQTLPDSALREGVVEAVKMAVMLNAEDFQWYEQHLDRILVRDADVLTECVTKAVQMKADVVSEDEHEHTHRMFLNFGHTIGHAVEALSKFAIPHGQAVAIGMRAEMMLAGCADAERVTEILKRMDMPVTIPATMDRETLWDLMRRDKKNIGGVVRMAVPTTIGSGEIQTIDHDAFLKLSA